MTYFQTPLHNLRMISDPSTACLDCLNNLRYVYSFLLIFIICEDCFYLTIVKAIPIFYKEGDGVKPNLMLRNSMLCKVRGNSCWGLVTIASRCELPIDVRRRHLRPWRVQVCNLNPQFGSPLYLQ